MSGRYLLTVAGGMAGMGIVHFVASFEVYPEAGLPPIGWGIMIKAIADEYIRSRMIVLGLYWKRGTAGGAYASVIVGAVLGSAAALTMAHLFW